jgi:hypothetical protein
MNERIQLAADIEKLIRSKEPALEEAKRLVNFASKIRISDEKIIYTQDRNIRQGKKFVGHTNEAGQIDYQDDQESKQINYSGWYFERIGYYKVWQKTPGRIMICHWKKSIYSLSGNEETQAEAFSNGYYLEYDKGSKEVIEFGEQFFHKATRQEDALSFLLALIPYLISFLPGFKKQPFSPTTIKITTLLIPRWRIKKANPHG